MLSHSKRANWQFARAVTAFAMAIAVSLIDTRFATGEERKPTTSPLPLARYFSSKDLVAYLEFDGLDRHERSWKKTAAARLLNETTTGAMYEAMLPRIIEAINSTLTDIGMNSKELTNLVRHL